MIRCKRHILWLSSALLFIALQSCGSAMGLRTHETASIKENATYTLILYGGRYNADLENLAIMAMEGGRYVFEVYAPEFDYSVKKGMAAKEAVNTARGFLGHHHDYYRSIISSILDNEGNVIGYEIRPLYYPFTYGTMDYLDVGYYIKDGKVVVKIYLKPELKRRFFDDDGMIIRSR